MMQRKFILDRFILRNDVNQGSVEEMIFKFNCDNSIIIDTV